MIDHAHNAAIKANAPTFNDPDAAFDKAIADGRLQGHSPHRILYAGNYMYMGTVNGRDTFKNIDTRRYLS